MKQLFLMMAALLVINSSLAMEDQFPREIYLHIATDCTLKDFLNLSECSKNLHKTIGDDFLILLARQLSPYEIKDAKEAKRILRSIDRRVGRVPISIFGIEEAVYFHKPGSGRDTVLSVHGQVFQKCTHGGWLSDVLELINLPPDEQDKVIAVKQYHLHAIALAESGQVYAWGWNDKGQLGLGFSSNDKIGPTPVKFLAGKKIVKVATGGGHSMAVGLDGQVFAWGNNDRAELALGHTNNVDSPTLMEGFSDEEVISLKLTYLTGLALTAKGKVYAFGPNDCGILGLGHNRLISCPIMITGLEGKRIVSIRHSFQSLALTDDGKVYAWGFGSYGTLGLGNEREMGIPTLVSQLEKERIIRIKSTCQCSYAISENGQVFGWGNNRSGELGLGYKGKGNVLLPTPMVGLGHKKVINLKPNCYYCLIFTSDHEIFITGNFPTGIKEKMNVESSDFPLFLGKYIRRNFCDGFEQKKDY